MRRLRVQLTVLLALLGIPTGLPVVWGDPDKVEQILTNLVGNAIKYSPGGGEVSSPSSTTATRCR